jgi:hypothetical protein
LGAARVSKRPQILDDSPSLVGRSTREVAPLIEYIEIQAEHHRKRTFADEYRELLQDAGSGGGTWPTPRMKPETRPRWCVP